MFWFTDKRIWNTLVRTFLKSMHTATSMPYCAGTILLAAVLAAICYWAYRREKLSFAQAVACPCLGAWCALVLTVTLLARTVMKKAAFKLMPFWSYTAIASGKKRLLAGVLLNVGLFLPIGFLLPVIWKKAKLRHAVLAGAAFSAIIEISQLLTKRGWFEFDDIFHNTLGAVIGYGLYRACQKIAELVARALEKRTEIQGTVREII